MAYPENALTLDILPLSADTARLVRVYGTEPCIALPGTLPVPEGGSFAVTELGDYCFSEKPRSLPAADKTCRYEAAPDGTARLTRAFGQAVGGTCRRYDFDFDAPAADEEALHPAWCCLPSCLRRRAAVLPSPSWAATASRKSPAACLRQTRPAATWWSRTARCS